MIGVIVGLVAAVASYRFEMKNSGSDAPPSRAHGVILAVVVFAAVGALTNTGLTFLVNAGGS